MCFAREIRRGLTALRHIPSADAVGGALKRDGHLNADAVGSGWGIPTLAKVVTKKKKILIGNN